MVDCNKVLKNIYRLLEEDPATPFCAELNAHLKNCEACARCHKELTELVELCRSSPNIRMQKKHKEELKRFLLRELKKGGKDQF